MRWKRNAEEGRERQTQLEEKMYWERVEEKSLIRCENTSE